MARAARATVSSSAPPPADPAPAPPPARWRRWRVELEAAAVGLTALAVYAAGACPTIYVGDSGELVAAVDVLGIPHPSGYPLYVLLGKLWTLLLPVGSVAYRMSLFSAASAAAACAVLYHLCRRLGLGAPAAAFASLLLAVSPSLWGEANVQRVYALNLLFVLLVVWWAFEWWRTGRDRALLVACFLCGLGASNHTFLGFVAVAVGVFALASRPELLRRPRLLAALPAVAIAGLLPYAYLPIRSRMDPELDWGNPETLEGFLGVVLRRDFWNRKWIEGPTDLLVIGADYLKGLGVELLWVGAALMVAGVWAARRRRWPVLLPLLIMFANAAAMAAHGSRSDIFIWHRYYVPSYGMAALLAGMGLQALLERWPPPARLRALAWAALAVPLAGVLLHWNEFDRSRYRVADDFSRKLLDTLPPGAHLAATDDNILFVLIYLKFVEGLRPDVDLILQGVGGANLPNLRFNPDEEGLFFTHHPNWRNAQLAVVPVGLVFQVARPENSPPLRLPGGPLEGADDPDVPKDYLTQNLIGQWHYMLGSTFETRDWRRAWAEFQRAARAAPGNDVLFYNLGLIYSGNGLFEEALAAFQRSHEINPRHIASRERVRPIDKVLQARAEAERVRELESRLGGGLPPAGTAAYHRALAGRLAAAGEDLAAQGHLLRAEVTGE